MKSITILPFLCVLAAALPATINHKEPNANHFAPLTRIHHPATVEQDQEAPIDNRPQTPSASAVPSVILASPKPIQSTYLLGLLGVTRPSEQPAVPKAAIAVSKDAGPAPLRHSESRHETQKMHAARPHVSRQYVDMAIIGFVAMFLLTVVAMESKESIRKLSCVIAKTNGPIYLDTEAAVPSQPLSVQAWAYSDEEVKAEAVKIRV